MTAKSFDKIIEEIGGMSVIELSDLIKAIEEKFGVSAAMPVSGGAPVAAEAAPAEEAKTTAKVILEDGGSEKIKVIRALRTIIPTLGLTEAKTLAETAGAVVAESMPIEDAKKAQEALTAAGAKVKLV